MIVDMVKYFLQQEAYSGPGDVAVLCTYLGQLLKVKAALKDINIDVYVDDRDVDQLEKEGMVDNVTETVAVARHVRPLNAAFLSGE